MRILFNANTSGSAEDETKLHLFEFAVCEWDEWNGVVYMCVCVNGVVCGECVSKIGLKNIFNVGASSVTWIEK